MLAPGLDLGCVYGENPVGDPSFYSVEDPGELLLDPGAAGPPARDLLRNRQKAALFVLAVLVAALLLVLTVFESLGPDLPAAKEPSP